MRKKAEEKANVKILYLKCQFFPKTRSLFPKKRAYFSLYCHLRNCIFMHIARAQVPPPAPPRPSVRVRRFPRRTRTLGRGAGGGTWARAICINMQFLWWQFSKKNARLFGKNARVFEKKWHLR